MLRFLKTFIHDTRGAVTVDWVFLSACVVGLAVAAVVALNDGTTDVASDTGDYVAEMSPTTF
ncbi:hypothetical protein RXV86_08690 [Alisedimentitalea sp. MJ-SS2]|uniref:hypothetical protein n=1 Tax=Aliisedimentitalea sp. MJ-SS2 TaxID=3049795 RepID=UPI002906D865|nr:hypothetical protein [Alisedimentitalea sp. MJ-SS2]MDU8927458.1 hypothetical protein [Alisedimentitalea sp. MJ-SS2]